MTPASTLRASHATSALIRLIVSAWPPAPGLSCVSARMIGRPRARRRTPDLRDRLFDRVQLQRELAFAVPQFGRELADRRGELECVAATAVHRGPALGHVRRRKSRQDAERHEGRPLGGLDLAHQGLQRLDQRGLRGERDQVIDRLEVTRDLRPAQDVVQHPRRPRSALGHVHVGVGAIRHECRRGSSPSRARDWRESRGSRRRARLRRRRPGPCAAARRPRRPGARPPSRRAGRGRRRRDCRRRAGRRRSMAAMRSNASRVTRPEGWAEHQVNGTRSWCSERASCTKPAAGRLIPATASNIAAPRVRPGQASGASKSANVAGTGENVFVSCWKPPTAMRAMPGPPPRTNTRATS